MPLLRQATLLGIAAALAACGGSRGRALGPTTAARSQAAEPAAAPPAARRPAGLLIRVGLIPEGIAADSDTGLVIVAVRDPPRLLVLDAASGAIVRRIPVPAPPRHLELAAPGGPVLVPSERSGRLLELSLPGGGLRSIAVGAHPHDAAAAAAGRVLVGNEFGRSLSVIEGQHVVRTLGGFLQPGGLAATGGDVAVVDVRGDTLTLIDARTLATIGRAGAGEGPTHVVADTGGRLFVVDTRRNAILTYTARPALRLLGRFSLPATPYGIAIDRLRRRLWVTLTGTDTLAELSIAGAGEIQTINPPAG